MQRCCHSADFKTKPWVGAAGDWVGKNVLYAIHLGCWWSWLELRWLVSCLLGTIAILWGECVGWNLQGWVWYWWLCSVHGGNWLGIWWMRVSRSVCLNSQWCVLAVRMLCWSKGKLICVKSCQMLVGRVRSSLCGILSSQCCLMWLCLIVGRCCCVDVWHVLQFVEVIFGGIVAKYGEASVVHLTSLDSKVCCPLSPWYWNICNVICCVDHWPLKNKFGILIQYIVLSNGYHYSHKIYCIVWY